MKFLFCLLFVFFNIRLCGQDNYQTLSKKIAYQYAKVHYGVDFDSIYKKDVEFDILSHSLNHKDIFGAELIISYRDETGYQYKWVFSIYDSLNVHLETFATFYQGKGKFIYFENDKISAKGWGDIYYIHRVYFYDENQRLARILLFARTKVILSIRIGGRGDNWGLYHLGSSLDLSHFGAEYNKLSFDE